MDTLYSSFLIRCWCSADGAARLVIEHVESGQRVAVPSLAAAQDLLTAWALSPPIASALAAPAPPPATFYQCDAWRLG
jgi:hypothetical protein